MSKFNGNYSVKLADQEMPDEFIETVLKFKKTVAGFAVATTEGDQPVIKLERATDGDFSLDDIKGMQEEYKDSTCIFYFADFPEGFTEESAQPFVCIEDASGEPELLMFSDGNFDEKAVAGSKHSPDYDVFNKYIRPAIKRIHKGSGGEIHETINEIATDPSIPDLINMLFKGRGMVTFLASNGEMATFGENALEAKYDWGWSTNPCGYGVPEQQTPLSKAVEVVKRGFGGSKKLSTAVTASPDKGKPTVLTNTGKDAGTDESHKYHAPPKSATKKEKGEFYLQHNEGIIPPGYKDCPPILKAEFRSVKSLKDLGKAVDAAVKRPIADVVPVRNTRQTATSSPAVTNEVLPVLPPSQLKTLAQFMKEHNTGKNVNEGRSIIDPKRIAEMEAEHATFAEIAGMKGLEDTFNWKYEAWVLLGQKVGIDALALLGWNTSLAYQKFLAAEESEETEQEEIVEEKVEPKKFGGGRKLR